MAHSYCVNFKVHVASWSLVKMIRDDACVRYHRCCTLCNHVKHVKEPALGLSSKAVVVTRDIESERLLTGLQFIIKAWRQLGRVLLWRATKQGQKWCWCDDIGVWNQTALGNRNIKNVLPSATGHKMQKNWVGIFFLLFYLK